MKKIFVLFICAFLLAFSIASIFKINETVVDKVSKRNVAAPLDSFASPGNLKKAIQSHFDNKILYKEKFYDLVSDKELQYFNRSIKPNKALIGKEGWFFLGDDLDKVVEETAGLRHYTELEIKKLKNKFLLLKRTFSQEGVEFVVVVAPNKGSIYPEYLPFPVFDKTKLDVVEKQKYPGFINLKPALLRNKDYGRLYHKTDSHWNSFGAFMGYRYLINYLTRSTDLELVPLSRKEIEFDTVMTGGLDIVDMIKHDATEEMIGSRIIDPNEHYRSKILGRNLYYRNNKNPNHEKVHKNLNCREECLDKVIFYRDSFGGELIDLLLYNTKQLNVIHSSKLDLDYIKKEKPDLVILEVVERRLDAVLDMY